MAVELWEDSRVFIKSHSKHFLKNFPVSVIFSSRAPPPITSDTQLSRPLRVQKASVASSSFHLSQHSYLPLFCFSSSVLSDAITWLHPPLSLIGSLSPSSPSHVHPPHSAVMFPLPASRCSCLFEGHSSTQDSQAPSGPIIGPMTGAPPSLSY